MQSYKSISIIALAIMGVFVFTSCSEDPESKATREARAACEKAIAIMQSIGDVEKARAALTKVSLSQLRGKDLAGLVAMVKGSMLIEEAGVKSQGAAEAGSVKAGFATLAKREADAMGPLAAKLYEYKRLDGDKVRMQKTLEGTQESLAQLKAALTGSNGNGLEAQLSASQAEVANLRKEMGEWEAKADAGIEEANRLQAEAQDLFNKADLATGAEREQLKQKGYDVLLGKGGGQSKEAILVNAQAAMDQVGFVESKMKVAQARVTELGKTVQDMKESIAGLEKTAGGEQLKGSMDEVTARQAKLTSEISAQLSEIEKAGSEYASLAEDVAGLYGKAAEEFTTAAGNKSGTPGVAKFALADCKYRGGMMISSIAAANESLGLRAQELVKNAVDGYTVKKLGEIMSGHTDRQKAALAAAIKMLGEACESYKGVTGVGKPAKSAAVSSNVMAYLEMLSLAGKAGDKAAMAGMAEELKALEERGKESDEKFADTPAGKMLAAASRGVGQEKAEAEPKNLQGVKAAALEQAKASIKASIREQMQKICAMPQAQRGAVAAQLKTQMSQFELSTSEQAALDAMIAAGTVDEAVVSVLAEKAMAMAAKVMAQSPDAMKQMVKTQLKQAFEQVFAMQGAERANTENKLKNSFAQLGLSESEQKSVSDMLAAGKVDDAVLDMMAEKSVAAVKAAASQSGQHPSAPAAPTVEAQAPKEAPAPAEPNGSDAVMAEPNNAAK